MPRFATTTKSGDSALETETAVAERPVFGRRNLVVAGVLCLLAFMVLISFQLRIGINPVGVSGDAHYVFQAESLLHGHWDVSMPPDSTDVVLMGGKVFIAYPPFPAFVLVPFVAIFGLSTSDVLFTTIASACIPALLYLLFEQVRANGLNRRGWIEHFIIAILCYLGSISLWLSLNGQVWYTGHIVCMVTTLLALILALRRHFTWGAVLLACAFLTRYAAILGLPFLLYLAWQDGGTLHLVERFARSLLRFRPDWGAVPWKRLWTPVAVIAAAGLLLAWRNIVIFGSPFETGYTPLLHQTLPEVRHGLFSLQYVPANILADFFSFPHVIFQGPFDRSPAIDMLNGRPSNGFLPATITAGGSGVSVFATTPLFLLLFWRNQRFSLLRAALWVTVLVIVGLMLGYQSTGWYQFGARYLYDAYPYAFLILVLGEARVDLRLAALGLLGIVVNALAAHQVWTGQLLHL